MYTDVTVAIVRHWPKWLPGSDFRHQAAVTRQQLGRLREEPYKGVLSNMVHSLGISFTTPDINTYFSGPWYCIAVVPHQLAGEILEGNPGFE